MAPHLDVRGLEGSIIAQPTALAHPCGAVVSLLPGAASGVRCRLPRLAERGLSTGFAPQQSGPPRRGPRFAGRRLGTHTVVRDADRDVGGPDATWHAHQAKSLSQ
jgi:hypothetical protein